jgi:lysyl-tRNA synthetase class I
MLKIISTILAILYAIWPFDLIPNYLIGIGWVDDILILALVWYYFFSNRPKSTNNFQQFKKQYDYYQHRKYGYQQQSNNGNYEQQRQGYQRQYEYQRPTGSQKKDPYTVLGVERNASVDEIKKAYRRLVSTYHPDKVLHMGEEFQKLAEIKFKEIQEAYQQLKVRG